MRKLAWMILVWLLGVSYVNANSVKFLSFDADGGDANEGETLTINFSYELDTDPGATVSLNCYTGSSGSQVASVTVPRGEGIGSLSWVIARWAGPGMKMIKRKFSLNMRAGRGGWVSDDFHIYIGRKKEKKYQGYTPAHVTTIEDRQVEEKKPPKSVVRPNLNVVDVQGDPMWREIESSLVDAGFNPGKIDGVVDSQTRQAIENWNFKHRSRESRVLREKDKEKLAPNYFESKKEKEKEKENEPKVKYRKKSRRGSKYQ